MIKILDVIFLSTDWDENSEEAHHFLINNNVYGQHYRKIEGNDQEFINKICPNWTGALPFTGIYNKKLDLISYWEGKKDEDFFINVIDSLIKLKEEKNLNMKKVIFMIIVLFSFFHLLVN